MSLPSPATDLVTVTSRHTVHCANEASLTNVDEPFRLGPFDQYAGFVPVQVVWVYGCSSLDSEIQPIRDGRFQRAIELLLDYYPHLTGRIRVDPGNGIREITHLGTGAEILVAKCSERLDRFLPHGQPSTGRIMQLPGAGNALLAPFDPNPATAAAQPILAVQLTHFACGGVSLGVRLHHSICDADGYFQLVRDLAELYRGIQSGNSAPLLTHPPHILPYMSDLVGSADLTQDERETALGYKPELCYVDPPIQAEDTTSALSSESSTVFPPPPSPAVGRFWRYSSRELSILKANAADPAGGWVSTFDALAAHLHQRVYRARLKLRANDPSHGDLSPPDFLAPVNLRSRIGLAPRYFPNALFTSYTTASPADAETLATGPLWQVAKAIHDVTRSPALMSADEISRTLRWIALQPDMREIKTGFRYGSGSFMVSAWNKFNMYEGFALDDGVSPTLVSPPFTPSSLVDGLAYLLPPEDGEAGAIEVSLALSEPVWRHLDLEVTQH